MQERLFGKLEGKGIKILNADANLSTLVEELKSSGIDPEYLEDSLTYRIGLSGDINLEDLTKRSPLSEEDRALNKKIEDQVFISMRNEIAAKKVREQL